MKKSLPCMQFFARGVFAWPAITGLTGQREGVTGNLRTLGWSVRALILSGLDWPLRKVTQGDTSGYLRPIQTQSSVRLQSFVGRAM